MIGVTDMMSREIRLASRPSGIPTAANFSLARTELEPLQDQQVLVRNVFMSVDPYMRGRMNAGKSYVPPFEVGKPLDGGAVGEVIESRAKNSSRAMPSLPALAGANTSLLRRKSCIRSAERFSRSRFILAPSA